MKPRYATLALLLILFSQALKSEPQYRMRRFYVKEIRGRVLAWEPWTSKWVPITPESKLWESTLVQVHPKSSITLELDMTEGFTGIKAESLVITLDTPATLRLEESFLRKVDVSNLFIPKMPDVLKAQEALIKGPMLKSMNEAWERMAAILVKNQDDKVSNNAGQAESEGSQSKVAVRSRQMKLFTPVDQTTSTVEQLPFELNIQWQHVADKIDYEIRVWKFEQPRPEPLTTTQLDFHSVKIFEEGGYFVQVATSDGKWQSNVHRVFISLPLNGRTMNTRNLASDLIPKPLPLTSPPKDFLIAVTALPSWLTFSWETGPTPRESQYYEFALFDQSGKNLLKRTCQTPFTQIKFTSPGSYRWSVKAITPPNQAEPAGNTLFSETRDLKIEDFRNLSRRGDPFDAIEDFIVAGKPGILYIDKGL